MTLVRRMPPRLGLVLAAGLAFTALVVASAVSLLAERARLELDQHARVVQDAVLDRVETAVALLNATAGLLASHDGDIGVADFNAYMSRIALRERYPGILGIGFSRRVAPEQREQVELAMRQQGRPEFRIWPGYERDQFHTIVVLEPLDERNRAAIGYDMFTDGVRREAMTRARDSGAPAASAIVSLVQEIDERKQPGFLVFLPVYREGSVPSTIAARRAQLIGFAYAPIRAGDFISTAVAQRTESDIAFAVFHGAGPQSSELLYSNEPEGDSNKGALAWQVTASVLGQPWTFVAAPLSWSGELVAIPVMLGLGGLALTALVVTLLRRDGRAREAVQAALDRELAARGQVEHANRMKDEFLATLSHELRTPLSAIVGWAAVLRRGAPGEADYRNGLEAIDRNAKAQARLIEDLLDMNRIVSGKLRMNMQPVDVSVVVADALATVAPAAAARGVAVHEAGPELLMVRGDPARLQQVVWNLLSNAVKFTPPGGRVDVSFERAGRNARIAVTDTGEGIEARFLERIFDRFAQVDSSMRRPHGGLGLGLAIVRELVALHGGTVRAHSAGPGRGSTFAVEVPLIASDAGPASEAPTATTAASLEGVDVVVVDDEPDGRELVRFVLGRSGARVRCAASADEALRLFTEPPPDVLVSDIGMPGVDGFELMRRIRALPGPRAAQTPAVALTAYARDEDRRAAMQAGFTLHLTKPVDPEALVAAIASLAAVRAQDAAGAGGSAAASRDH